jgi:hypothetical protein
MLGASRAMPSASPKIDQLICVVRGQRVILDVDLAWLYGASTKQFNQAFKRNRDKFPADFAFKLTVTEFANLRSQIVTSSSQITGEKAVGTNSSQFVISPHGGRRYRPWAFTEHGALQAANILRSPRARDMSIFVIRAFVKMCEARAANAMILKRLAEIDKTLLTHDRALRDLYGKLLPLLGPPPEKPRVKIGFHQGNR